MSLAFFAHDVAPDGRFLINTVVDEGAPAAVTVVTNWTATLAQ